MLIALMGDSCVGKSAIAKLLQGRLDAAVFSGKDYLKLAKSESAAAALFRQKLAAAVSGGNLIYVISEKDQLASLPEGCVRILVAAGLEQIKSRFAARMHGNLPAPVAAMLERKHGQFENCAYDLRIDTDSLTAEEACVEILTAVERVI